MERGSQISHYEIAEQAGEGGMAVVYKARDLKLPRFVALKFLTPSASGPDDIARLKQEAEAVSSLNHPNIATLYELDEAGGQFFLAFEYLPGGTLKAALDDMKRAGQRISLEQGLEYAVQLAEGLAHAHQNGVVHRDIKAGNALFSVSGTLKITDFGLAKVAEGADLTRTGSVLGTPATMSPEQAQGREADERSDVFSLGVLLYEMFTGEAPFKGANVAAVMYQVVHEPPRPMTLLRPDLPAALEQIVAKALQKQADERYQSAVGLAADLRALRREFLSGTISRAAQETIAMTAPALAQAPSAGRRPRHYLKMAGLAAAAVVLVLLTWAWLRGQFGRSYARALPAEKRLAILPFTNIGGDANDQVFIDGVREVVIGQITSLERPGSSLMVVISPDEVRAKQIESPQEAMRRLGATLVLTGSVVHSGAQSRFSVSLNDPQYSEVLRTESIDISGGDLLAAANRVVQMLDVSLTSDMQEALKARDSSNPQATRAYIEGRGYLTKAENLEPAIEAFRNAVSKDPGYAVAWAGLADGLSKKGGLKKDALLFNEARQDAARSLQLNPHLADSHVTMAQIELALGDPKAAEQELRQAIQIEPANARAYRVLGNLYVAQNDFADAEATYQKALKMRGDAESYNDLGYFYYSQNRPEFLESAKSSFLSAVGLAPDNYKAHYNLSAVYAKLKQYSAAVKEAQASIFISPTAPAHSNAGNLYYYSGDLDSAILEFSEAARLAPKSYQAWADLADACRWAPGHEAEAPAHYRQAIELLTKESQAHPEDPILHGRLAMYHVSIRDARDAIAAEDRAEAAQHLQQALRNGGSQARVQFYAVLVYEQLKDRKNALKAVEQVLRLGPTLIREIESSPVLKSLRKDPLYRRLVPNQP